MAAGTQVANLIHRAIVFSCMGFGIYGTVVIAQNLMVKSRAIKEYEAEKAAGTHPIASDAEAPQIAVSWRK